MMRIYVFLLTILSTFVSSEASAWMPLAEFWKNPRFAKIGGNAPLFYIPVTLTNAQTGATQANLAVKISVNSNTNSAKYHAALRNANWQDGKGNVLNSWLESGKTNTSTASVYWVNLASNTIAASGGTLVIYQAIYATGVNAFNTTNTGAEPNYTGTYGEYDNGSSVFPLYQNFTGTSVPSGWTTVIQTGGTVTVNNGVTISETSLGKNTFLFTSSTYSYDILESNFGGTPTQTLASASTLFYATTIPTISGGDYGFGTAYRYDYCRCWPTAKTRIVKDVTGTQTDLSTVNSGFTAGIYTASWPATGSQNLAINYSSVLSSTDSSIAKTPAYIGAAAVTGGTLVFNWIRARVYPPSGVLPSVSVGTVANH